MLSFLPSCYSSYGAWTFTPVGLAPTDHASLRWTHRFSLPIWWNFPEEDFWGTPRRQPPVRVAVQSADESRSELHRPTTYDSFIL
jgi:hypothetical protein